ncbi:hypothetical protein JBE04_20380 [Streptomyces sp. PRKS01-29]|nr:hypothetical protein [Streptomyces sabulosicollis]MBI0296751.1 hypothetical protein [Streptomyces sabulosicollis]
MNTQLELFPPEAVVGTGRPRPWPVAPVQDTTADTQPTQDEEPPLDLDEERAA